MQRFSAILLASILGCGGAIEPPTETDEPLLNANQATEQVMDEIMSTPHGRAEVERIGNKEVQLTRFQQANGISERTTEAAIKEWVLTHNRNFDWNLEDVKAICLRNKRSGIPYEYLPESEK